MQPIPPGSFLIEKKTTQREDDPQAIEIRRKTYVNEHEQNEQHTDKRSNDQNQNTNDIIVQNYEFNYAFNWKVSPVFVLTMNEPVHLVIYRVYLNAMRRNEKLVNTKTVFIYSYT